MADTTRKVSLSWHLSLMLVFAVLWAANLGAAISAHIHGHSLQGLMIPVLLYWIVAAINLWKILKYFPHEVEVKN